MEFLSPYCLSNSGLTADLARWFVEHCPCLETLRDTSSWTGPQEKWRAVAEAAKKYVFSVSKQAKMGLLQAKVGLMQAKMEWACCRPKWA